ncbi:interleukin-15 [Ctenopharyngodon idella]|uniref:Interleukin n=2 Tax=Ctenopharyngodon idella TaxID=7959 RepID=A0A4D6NV48_CTEID|nr:interleukin-15 [Ctenopharyngodon idella]QCE20959.1 interleukin-15 [Ctenopharyngodon idella]QDC35383.1 IL-15 [Ctenopharyngodon idella]QYF10296.1 interleukin-15 [Ctenopharyngodon idella]
MILMTLFLAFIVGFWKRPPKLKPRRTGRCVCNPWCFENHMECLLNSEVWNSILILSCLSALLPMAEGHAMQALKDLQKALDETEQLFNRSDARLYTPDIGNIKNCTYKFIDCFLMEMNVLLHEDPTKPEYIFKIKGNLEAFKEKSKNCARQQYYCELQKLDNSMNFFKTMKEFLQLQSSLCQGEKIEVVCD